MEPTKQKFLLIRHAQSEFNFSWISSQNPSLFSNKNLIDCKITQIGESQISECKEKTNLYPISLVLVSPLRRTLQTAKLLFENHPNKPSFLVVPYLRERIDASCDLSDFIDKPFEEFEEFDWSLMIKLAGEIKGKYWLTEELGDVPEIEEIRKKEVEEQKTEILRKMDEYIKSKKKEHENKAEKYESVRAYQKTIGKLMDFLDDLKKTRKFNKEDVIAIVAHSGALRELRTRGGVDNAYLKNCEMREFLY